ncbi:tol-pal system protein YbgF [bacterium]|nr:tol-pal system protein YbgF [candidate division CSSED10-310 bacterium]
MMNRSTIGIGLVVCIGSFVGCATNQPIMDRMSRIETMQQTERAESIAETEAIKKEIESVRIRLDTISKAQADLMEAMDRQNLLLQNAIENIQHTTVATPFHQLPEPGDQLNEFPGDPINPRESDPDQRPEVVYQTAYNDYVSRNYDLAVLEFQSFLAAFPDSDLADNAQYWIGECFYSQQRFDEALTEFGKVIQRYPSGDKFVPATLKKGLCMIESGNVHDGQVILEKLIEDYPYSTEARIAKDRLENP